MKKESTTYFCDRCGVEIDEPTNASVVVFWEKVSLLDWFAKLGMSNEYERKVMELCPICRRTVGGVLAKVSP